jgi:DNA-binding PadR family transcriptional regulator
MGRRCCTGEHHPPEGWPPRHPLFGVRRGDFRFLVLMALGEKPMHGYALIQEISETYLRPVSAGIVYPTLQELGDMGLVTSEESDGKKIYTLTPEGRKHLDENRETVERLREGREHADAVGRFGLMKELRDMQAMTLMGEALDDEKMKKIQEILADAKKRMAAVVFE